MSNGRYRYLETKERERFLPVYRVMWRRRDANWLDSCEPGVAAVGGLILPIILIGNVIGVCNEKPVRISYVVGCDAKWRTRWVHVLNWSAGEQYATYFTFRANGKGKWHRWEDDKRRWRRAKVFDGLIDFDLGFTPAMNLLLIRRLALEVGQSANVTAAWMCFPEFGLAPLEQTYTRLSERVYRYESSGGFVTEIDVDDHAVPMTYDPIWERVAAYP